jgi:hypothetical protein
MSRKTRPPVKRRAFPLLFNKKNMCNNCPRTDTHAKGLCGACYTRKYKKWEQVAIPYTEPMQDGRRKIHPSQHATIRKLHRQGVSQRSLARQFKVSRRLIVFILHPERYKERLTARIAQKVHLQYYNKDKHTAAIKKYRNKKRKLNLLINKPYDKS